MISNQQADNGSLLSVPELAAMMYSTIESLTWNQEESVCEGLVFTIAEKLSCFLQCETESWTPHQRWSLANSVVGELKQRAKPPGDLRKRLYHKILNQVLQTFEKKFGGEVDPAHGITIETIHGTKVTVLNNGGTIVHKRSGISDYINDLSLSDDEEDDNNSRNSNTSRDEVVRMLDEMKVDGKDSDYQDGNIDCEELWEKLHGIPKQKQQPNSIKFTKKGRKRTRTTTQWQAFKEANIYEELVALYKHNELIMMMCQYQYQRIQSYLKQFPQHQEQQPPPIPPTPMAPNTMQLFQQQPPLQQVNPLFQQQQQQQLLLQPQFNQFLQQPAMQFFPQQHQHQQQQVMGYGWNTGPIPMMQQAMLPVPPSPHGAPAMFQNNNFPTPMMP